MSSTPQASTSDADDTFTRPSATIPDSELPPVSNTAHNLRPSTVAPRPDSPLKIHNRSVEEYQQVYHEVVDDMLRSVWIKPPFVPRPTKKKWLKTFYFFCSSQRRERTAPSIQFGAGTPHKEDGMGETEPSHHDYVY